MELAKEWAVCRPNDINGWVHKYELDVDGLEILDFQEKNVLSWLAELLKHREAANSKRYRMLAGLGTQYCLKSELAFSRLCEAKEGLFPVSYEEFNDKYNQRDATARKNMRDLVDSDANKVMNVFSTLFER